MRSPRGRSTSEYVRRRIAGLMDETLLRDMVSTLAQVHVLRELCEELERIRPTAPRAPLKSGVVLAAPRRRRGSA